MKFKHAKIIGDLAAGCFLAKLRQRPGYELATPIAGYVPAIRFVQQETVDEMRRLGLLDSQLKPNEKARPQ